MEIVVFPNDNNTVIAIPEPKNAYEKMFKRRPYHEVMFRKISEILITSGFVSKGIIDLGAWIGDNSVAWGMMMHKSIHCASPSGGSNKYSVYSIDPSTSNCDFIRRTLEMNNVNNVLIINKAISERKETISTNGNIDHCSFNNNDTGKTSVESIPLDILYEENVIEDVDYIHLDVEGMELSVIKGATNLIKENNPIISYEVHYKSDNLLQEITNHLKDYTHYMINEILPGCNPDCRNILAIPRIIKFDDTIQFIIDKLNVYNYIIVCHIGDRFTENYYDLLSDAINSFALVRGDRYACALYDCKNNQIIGKYGENTWTNKCAEHAKKMNGTTFDNIFIQNEPN